LPTDSHESKLCIALNCVDTILKIKPNLTEHMADTRATKVSTKIRQA